MIAINPCKPMPPLYHVTKVIARANRVLGVLPGLNALSLPIPMAGPDGTLWAIWLTTRQPGTPDDSDSDPHQLTRFIAAPSYVLTMRADFGSFDALRPISVELGFDGEQDEVFDPHTRTAKWARYVELVQEAAVSFAGGTHITTPATKRLAAELSRVCLEVAEPPLLRFYRKASPRFFAWLDDAASA